MAHLDRLLRDFGAVQYVTIYTYADAKK